MNATSKQLITLKACRDNSRHACKKVCGSKQAKACAQAIKYYENKLASLLKEMA
jgi:hypothetical protein